MKIFTNEDLINCTKFDVKGLNFFIKLINIDEKETKNIKYIYNISKKLPASIRGYHGGYAGGLYDHMLLVTNIAYHNYILTDPKKINEMNNKTNNYDLTDLIKASMYHDFGKVDHYTQMKNISFKFKSESRNLKYVRYMIQKDYNIRGKDVHVERCFVVIRNASLTINDNIQVGIIFHHGGWSKYYPQKSNKSIYAILHAADMIASQFYGV